MPPTSLLPTPPQESACWCLGYMAGHSPELAQQVVDAGAVPLLVLCVQEPELALKRVAASALSDIAKHTPELAQVGGERNKAVRGCLFVGWGIPL